MTVRRFRPLRGVLALVGLTGLAACAGDSATAPVTSPDADARAGSDSRPDRAFLIEAVNLGTLGGDFSRAADVNDAGVVVGQSTLADGSAHAFRWTAEGGMVALPTLGGSTSSAEAINALGYITGSSRTPDGALHAVLWTPSGEIRDLGTIAGGVSGGRAINDRNEIVGDIFGNETSGFTQHVFTWSEATGLVEHELGCTEISGAAITADGTLAGTTACNANTLGDYGIWRRVAGGSLEDIGGVPGAFNTLLRAMNDDGLAVGYSQDHATGVISAWTWDAAGGFRILLADAVATDVSRRGVVVGGDQPLAGGGGSAFVWSRRLGKVELPGLGGDIAGAEAISPDGRYVAGYATDASGAWRAVLWRPRDDRQTANWASARVETSQAALAPAPAKPAPCVGAEALFAPGGAAGCRLRVAAGLPVR